MTETTYSAELLSELLEIAKTTAVAASNLATQMRSPGIEVAATKSSVLDIVTEGDRATEQLIKKLILERRPDDGFLGEETGFTPGKTSVVWVVDPIDGTVNYLYNNPNWAVSIAAVDATHLMMHEELTTDPEVSKILVGAVYMPSTRELYSASAGGGAFLNDEKISGPFVGTDLGSSLVSTGYPYTADARARWSAKVDGLVDVVRDLRRLGAASLDICFVASGKQDAYIETKIRPWDWAAGAIIATEAGAVYRIANLRGISDPVHIVATKDVCEELTEWLERV
ncbi:MAG: inositol monophosphatase [Microbacteriaceae bacterium]|nr:inositol monophosphatase [Microbacteriaceae bacterium]